MNEEDEVAAELSEGEEEAGEGDATPVRKRFCMR